MTPLPRTPRPVLRSLPCTSVLALGLALGPASTGCQAFKQGMNQSLTAQKLVPVCEGETVEGAAAYVPGTGAAPIAAARDLGEGYKSADRILTMDTPQPTSLAEAQLVLCVDAPQVIDLGVCAYDTVTKVAFVTVPGTRSEGPTFPRTRTDQVVRVVEAATGEVVATETLEGAEPPACDATLIGGPDASYFRGQEVGDFTIGQWAEAFIAEH